MTFLSTSFVLFVLQMSCQAPPADGSPLRPIGALPDELGECSGMVALADDMYLGLNDSGNAAELYIFSLKRRMATRTIPVTGATNVDWEELAIDDQYIYIGDTGNNSGERKDLAIYKVRRDQVMKAAVDTIERIAFHYPEQSGTKSSRKHNFDCEAIISIGDSLYLFTKNRGDSKTVAYRLPKVGGSYAATRIAEFDAEGLVTGADWRMMPDGTGQLALIGYSVAKKTRYNPFILWFTDISDNRFFANQPTRLTFDNTLQTETIIFLQDNTVYVTNEEEHGDAGLIYEVNLD